MTVKKHVYILTHTYYQSLSTHYVAPLLTFTYVNSFNPHNPTGGYNYYCHYIDKTERLSN